MKHVQRTSGHISSLIASVSRHFQHLDYNDEIRQEQMWEMQILNTQRGGKPGGGIEAEIHMGGGGAPDSNNSTASSCSNGSMTPPPPAEGYSKDATQDVTLKQPPIPGCNHVQKTCMKEGKHKHNQDCKVPGVSVSSSPPLGTNHGLVLTAQHPALRGLEARTQAVIAATVAGDKSYINLFKIFVVDQDNIGSDVHKDCWDISTSVRANEIAPTQLVCRKRPLLPGGGTRLAMSPTKRTVLSILARARAAQAKELPDYHPVTNG
uniref:Uncharacterized protein n=1 Tax=Timema bartmani TaxID=61472 RepID=A0A7R9HYV7_9NEOP|nr:unnamed protein product [Timema bartmani]